MSLPLSSSKRGNEDIQITSGASEALFLLTWVVMQPGANIVIEEPCYENLPGVASALGLEVRRLPLRMQDGWRPNLDQVARLIDEQTRLLYLVHPHNPTGSTLQVEEMRAIAQMAERVGALVVNDELFRLIALDGQPTPAIIDVAEHAISIGDMTKPWGLGRTLLRDSPSFRTNTLRPPVYLCSSHLSILPSGARQRIPTFSSTLTHQLA